jgi:hypothetical protein
MPLDVSQFMAKSRRVVDPDLGPIFVREPTMADYRRAANDPWWWAACLSCEDGTPLLADPADLGRLSADVSTRLWEQVNSPHPTQPPPGGCGESQARNSET